MHKQIIPVICCEDPFLPPGLAHFVDHVLREERSESRGVFVVQGPVVAGDQVHDCLPVFGSRGRDGATQPTGRQLVLAGWQRRSEEHTSELQSLMRISYAVFCLKKKNNTTSNT